MATPLRLFCRILPLLSALMAGESRLSAASDGAPQTYVLVHGATGGGWDWRTEANLLTADGNIVYRPTLTGLGEHEHLANADVNLTTHVTDIVNLILFERLHDVVLVGHSYGGMVITGVMDKIPDRIRHVIFLDAAAPDDGQSMLDYGHTPLSSLKVRDGLILFPWVDETLPFPRDVPQPLKTYTEPVSYRNPAAKLLPVTYIWYNHPDFTPGEKAKAEMTGKRLNLERGWTIRTLDSDHNAQRSHPAELKALLEASLDDRNVPVASQTGK
jgi:pimeloyl-ACP methyl ester carboxylesterase